MMSQKKLIFLFLSNLFFLFWAIILCCFSNYNRQTTSNYIRYRTPDKSGVFYYNINEKKEVVGKAVSKVIGTAKRGLELFSGIDEKENAKPEGSICVSTILVSINSICSLFQIRSERDVISKHVRNEIYFDNNMTRVEYVDIDGNGLYDYKRLCIDRLRKEFIWIDDHWEEVTTEFSIYGNAPYAINIMDDTYEYVFVRKWLKKQTASLAKEQCQ